MQTLIAPSANFSPVNLRVPSATKSEEGAWGHRMAAYLRPDDAHPIQVQTLRKARMVVTRLRCDTGLSEISAPVPYEKAFVVALQLRESPFHELWLDDRPVAVGRYPERSVSILDLEQRPSMLLPNPFDSIHFHLTRTALDEISDDYGASRISRLSWPHGEIDPVTNHLGLTILPALENPKHTSMLFLDHAVFALEDSFRSNLRRHESAIDCMPRRVGAMAGASIERPHERTNRERHFACRTRERMQAFA